MEEKNIYVCTHREKEKEVMCLTDCMHVCAWKACPLHAHAYICNCMCASALPQRANSSYVLKPKPEMTDRY